VYIVVVVLCVLLSSYVYLFYCVCIAVSTSDAGLLTRSQYSEGPATGHLDTGSSWFPCVYKQMLRRFPTFQVATTCFSCSPPDLNLVVTNFIFCIHANRVTTQLKIRNIIILCKLRPEPKKALQVTLKITNSSFERASSNFSTASSSDGLRNTEYSLSDIFEATFNL